VYYCKEHADKDEERFAESHRRQNTHFDCVSARPASGPKTWRGHYAQNDNESLS
jgi:hypothetical protein